jgi:sugar phosphate isomerase/epimerase
MSSPPILSFTADSRTHMKSCITVSLVEEARGGPFVLWDDVATACEKAARFGFDAVEIFPPSAEAVNSLPLARILAGHGLKLAALGTGAGWVKHRLSLADPDADQRKRAIAFVRSIIDAAGAHGAMAIIGSMQGRWGTGVSAEDAKKYLLDALYDCSRHAAQYGVPLVYEPLNRYETNLVNTMSSGVELLSQLGPDHNVRLLADLFHMQIEETDVAASIVETGRFIGHVHFVDSNRRPVGNGHTDFRPILAALHAIDYEGYLSAEAFPFPDPDAAAEQTMLAYRYWTAAVSSQ